MPATPDAPEPTVRPSWSHRRTFLPGMVAAVLVLAFLGVSVASSDEGAQRWQAAVAERGRRVMPFDLDATTHRFDSHAAGGVQSVVADDPGDAGQISLIRGHLREELARFRAGDFGDPAAIHGGGMPGLATLQKSGTAIDIRYQDLVDGGRLTYRSEEPVVVAALHEWFAGQVSDHGRHAESGNAPGG